MLNGRAVPVYYGAETVDKVLPGPGQAVVKVSDFTSPKDLGEFLAKAGKDEAVYNSYLQWKTKKQKSDMDKFQNVIDMTGYKYTSLCRICEKLATDIPE